MCYNISKQGREKKKKKGGKKMKVERISLEEVGRRVNEWATPEEIEKLFGCDTDDLGNLAIAFLDSAFNYREKIDGRIVHHSELGSFEIE